ncbi:PTS fructose transporter subunit IIB [Oceanobacillus sp. FSL W8-0428]|uniref:PTS fructose transporter subunit IIB n=1 Tax=Oceanobacillus sojae TaxID=582851 RepID=A0A511ZM10_9BACI|nr:PTS fructose transporter subunit IIB [Oceanobacillus sojae]GEN88450.1 PTS fructose transporter subunit IIB [Oceanobacillus sojae]
MNIVGVAACTAGIAHTYIAKEKLMKAAQEAGHSIFVETQGTIGTQDNLTEEQIKEADVVVIAADVKINGKNRFKGKKTIEVPTDLVIKSPNKFIKKVEEVVAPA